jgi:hypothetical protein
MSTTAGAIDFGVNTKALDAGIGDDAAEEVNCVGLLLGRWPCCRRDGHEAEETARIRAQSCLVSVLQGAHQGHTPAIDLHCTTTSWDTVKANGGNVPNGVLRFGPAKKGD